MTFEQVILFRNQTILFKNSHLINHYYIVLRAKAQKDKIEWEREYFQNISKINYIISFAFDLDKILIYGMHLCEVVFIFLNLKSENFVLIRKIITYDLKKCKFIISEKLTFKIFKISNDLSIKILINSEKS